MNKNKDEFPTHKPCTECKVNKPLDDYSPSKLGKYGRNSKCKPCVNRIQYERKHGPGTWTPKVYQDPNATEKECTKCRKVKPIDEFDRRSENPELRKSHCKSCLSEWHKQHNQKEEVRLRHNENSRRRYAADREGRRAYSREWSRKNREKVNAQGRAKRARNLEHNRELERVRAQRRRSLKAGSVPVFRFRKSECPDHLCYWCGIDLNTPGVETHIDHIMPISLYGPDEDFNKVPTCSGCNVSKNAKHPFVWIAHMF